MLTIGVLKTLRVGHDNVNSLLPSYNDFVSVVINEYFDIIAVSETWLSDINTQNYTFSEEIEIVVVVV